MQYNDTREEITVSYYHFSKVAVNDRLGKIPTVTVSSDTCPLACPFKGGNGCYAEYNPIGLGGHWSKVSAGLRGGAFAELIEHVENLPENTLWRYGQAGDLPGKGDILNKPNLALLAKANNGKKGFAYTHKPLVLKQDRDAVKKANDSGFTINLSADNLTMADQKAGWQIGPAVVTVPDFGTMPKYTPEGRKLVPCPKQTHGITCRDCKLCAIPSRKSIIAFEAHGNGKAKVAAIASGQPA